MADVRGYGGVYGVVVYGPYGDAATNLTSQAWNIKNLHQGTASRSAPRVAAPTVRTPPKRGR